MPDSEITFSDQPNLEELVAALQKVGFNGPKWSYRYNVSMNELASCYKQRKFPLRCDVVAFNEGRAVCVFELDGQQHIEEEQEKRDARKEAVLARHGIRTWRMWNGELFNVREDGGKILRRHVKAHMYAPYGTLATDWKKLCNCKKEV